MYISNKFPTGTEMFQYPFLVTDLLNIYKRI
jgi:hypothetical protein